MGPVRPRVELATGYSELVDPVVQRERFEAQAKLAAFGDADAMRLDEDFLRAMEYAHAAHGRAGHGHRPAAHCADRREGVRDTILFPLVRPE